MDKKTNKILGILAGGLGSVLLIGVVLLLLNGSRISDIFNVRDIFSGTSAEAVTTNDASQPAASVTPSGTAVPGTTAAVPTQPTSPEAPTEPREPVYANILRVGVSRLDGNFNPFGILSEGDQDVMSLVGINLLTHDRAGKVIMMATEGEYSYYNGERYLYTGPADITAEYDEEKNETTYTLRLRDGIRFSDGTELTVDDLIFNLYVRLQPNYEGAGDLRTYDIVGLKNYYYNNSMAEAIVITDEDLAAELADPCEEVQSYIRNLIADILHTEADQCRQTWISYQALGYGNSAEEFFYNLYGLDLNYNILDKSLDRICDDVIESYGLDYRKLAFNYAVDENYFDEEITAYTRELLLSKRMREAGGEPVDYISGITRLGGYTVKLRLYGYEAEAVYQLFDMIIAPLHYYGDPAQYDYDAHQFGFPRGNYQIPEAALKHPLGAGPFLFGSYDGETVVLTKNDAYYKKTSDIDRLTIRAYGTDPQAEITSDRLDIVRLEGSRQVNETLRGVNSNDKLTGDSLYAEEILDLGYSYIGINADRVRVGNDARSEQSAALRQALLTAVSVFRDVSFTSYFGESVHVIDHPVSPFFTLVEEGDGTRKIFCQSPDGNDLFTDEDNVETRYFACVDAVRDFLIKAGFVYNSETGRFVEAPEGASLRYEIMLCGTRYEEHPAFSVLAYANSVLDRLGISLDFRYMSSTESMLVSLYLGEADMWFASWNCIGDPNFRLHYGSGESTNLFSVRDEELDGWIAEYEALSQTFEQDAAADDALRIMERVKEWAVELPCYTAVDYLVYNVNTVDVASLTGGHSLYWTWIDDVAFLEVIPRLVEGD